MQSLRGVAVDFADGAVNHDAFHVGVARYGIKYSFKNIGFDPMAEAFEYGIPVAKFGRQIAPWGPGSGDPTSQACKHALSVSAKRPP